MTRIKTLYLRPYGSVWFLSNPKKRGKDCACYLENYRNENNLIEFTVLLTAGFEDGFADNVEDIVKTVSRSFSLRIYDSDDMDKYSVRNVYDPAEVFVKTQKDVDMRLGLRLSTTISIYPELESL